MLTEKLVPKRILDSRESSIDFFRGCAILLVVFYHYDELIPFGMIGVDLFFVLSGYLVSQWYLKSLKDGSKAQWWPFLAKRFTKILPSYYFFLFLGYILVRLYIIDDFHDELIEPDNFTNYLFFYVNYDLCPPWIFQLSWSLCVEEHFYLFLTILFLILSLIKSLSIRKKNFVGIVILMIVLALVFRILYYDVNPNTYYETHFRMDALMLGVLLAYLRFVEGIDFKFRIWKLLLGLVLIGGSVSTYYFDAPALFEQALRPTLIPLGFFLLIQTCLSVDFGKLGIFRVFAYYSYNWYLWHPLVAFFIINKFELPMHYGLPLFLLISFGWSIIMTKAIEEPFIYLRKYLYKNQDN